MVCPDGSGSEKGEIGRRGGRRRVDMEKGRADEVGAAEECAEQTSRVVDLSPPVPLTRGDTPDSAGPKASYD